MNHQELVEASSVARVALDQENPDFEALELTLKQLEEGLSADKLSQEEKTNLFARANHAVFHDNPFGKRVDVFQHYKGGMYRVTHVSLHTETNEILVNYHLLSSPFVDGANEVDQYSRPLSIWLSPAPDGGKRFKPVVPAYVYCDDPKDMPPRLNTSAFCNKCGFVGVPDEHGYHMRPRDGQPCAYLVFSEAQRAEQDKKQLERKIEQGKKDG